MADYTDFMQNGYDRSNHFNMTETQHFSQHLAAVHLADSSRYVARERNNLPAISADGILYVNNSQSQIMNIKNPLPDIPRSRLTYYPLRSHTDQNVESLSIDMNDSSMKSSLHQGYVTHHTNHVDTNKLKKYQDDPDQIEQMTKIHERDRQNWHNQVSLLKTKIDTLEEQVGVLSKNKLLLTEVNCENSKLQAELKEKYKLIDHLEQNTKEGDKQVQILAEKVQVCEQEKEKLNQRIEKLTGDLQTITTEWNKMKSVDKQHNEKFSRLEQDLKDTEVQNTITFENLKSENEKLQTEILDKIKLIDHLDESNKEGDRQVQILMDKHHVLDKEKKKLLQQVEKLTGDLQKITTHLHDTVDEQHHQKSDQIIRTVQDAEVQTDNTSSDCEGCMKHEINNFKEEVKNKDKVITDIELQLESNEQEMVHINEQLTTALTETEILKSSKQVMLEQSIKFEKDVQRLENEAAQLKQEIALLRAENNNLRMNDHEELVKVLRIQLEEAQTNNKTIEETLTDANCKVQTLEEEKIKANDILKILEEEKVKANDRLVILEEQKITANNRLVTLEEEKITANDRLVILEEEKITANDRLVILEETKNKASKELCVLKKENEELKDKLKEKDIAKDLKKENLEIKNEIASLTAEKERLREIEQELDKAKSIHGITEEKLKISDDKLQRLEQQMIKNKEEMFMVALEKEELKHQIQDLSNRLSEEMGQKVASNEQNLENVSIKNRPMNIASEYELICSNEWLNAKTLLDEQVPTLNEESKSRLLVSVLLEAEKETQTLLLNILANIMKLIINPGKGTLEPNIEHTDLTTAQPDMPPKILNAIGDILRINSDNTDFNDIVQKIKRNLSEEFQECIDTLESPDSLLVKYIESCIRITWKMALQKPPMTLKTAGIGEAWMGEQEQNPSWGSEPDHPESVVKYYLHPMLYHGDVLMTKGKVFVGK